MTSSVYNYLMHSPISPITLKSMDFVIERWIQKSSAGSMPKADYNFDLKMIYVCKLESNNRTNMALLTP